MQVPFLIAMELDLCSYRVERRGRCLVVSLKRNVRGGCARLTLDNCGICSCLATELATTQLLYRMPLIEMECIIVTAPNAQAVPDRRQMVG